MTDKECTHLLLYLPLWDAEELVDAVDVLDISSKLAQLNVKKFPRRKGSRHTLDVAYRFDLFGGVARECLESDKLTLNRHIKALEQAIATIDLATGIPRPKRVYDENLKLASGYVTQLLRKQCSLINDEATTHSKSIMELPPEAAALD